MEDIILDVNRILKSDQDCKDYLPMLSSVESLSKAFQDGIVFAKLINVVQPDAVDLTEITLDLDG